MRDIEAHRGADQSYIEEGVKLVDLAHRAHELFESQPPIEKRKLLDFVLSNCTWKYGELSAAYRQSFDLVGVTIEANQAPPGGSGDPGRFRRPRLRRAVR